MEIKLYSLSESSYVNQDSGARLRLGLSCLMHNNLSSTRVGANRFMPSNLAILFELNKTYFNPVSYN